MDELYQMHCSQVDTGTPRLSEQEIDQYIKQLPGWSINVKDNESRLERVFKFKDFDQAVDFTNNVAHEAGKEDHHPAILTEWGRVTVTWWTHTVKGLHQNDFIMAAKTDRLFAERF